MNGETRQRSFVLCMSILRNSQNSDFLLHTHMLSLSHQHSISKRKMPPPPTPKNKQTNKKHTSMLAFKCG